MPHWAALPLTMRIGLTFALGLLLPAIAAMLPSTKYTAEAALLLRLGREYIYTPEVGDAQGGSPATPGA